MIYWILFAIATAAAIGADIYDVTMTEKGLKAKVAVEGFDWLVGPDPTATRLYLRDGLLIALSITPGAVFYAIGNAPLGYGALTAQVVLVIKHIQGARAWAALLKK